MLALSNATEEREAMTAVMYSDIVVIPLNVIRFKVSEGRSPRTCADFQLRGHRRHQEQIMEDYSCLRVA